MPDYSLGRARGRIEIDYDGGGAGRAARDLDSVAAASAGADQSLTRTQRTLRDTGRELGSTGDAAEGYQQRLRDVEEASRAAEAAESRHRATLLDSAATLDDIKAAEDDVTEARKRHTRALEAERDAHRSLSDGMSVGRRALDGFSNILPNLSRNLDRLSIAEDNAGDKASTLASGLESAARVVAWLGPQGRVAAAGLTLASDGIEKVSGSAKSGGSSVGDFVKEIAGFEVAVGKISGLALGAGSLGGLGGLGAAAGVQGVVNLAGAAKELSGVLGLLPAVISGVGFSMSTLDLAFRGVGDALTDMMADDPKKFLEDIKDMGPAAAEAMLGIAQFRDQFKLAAGAVQNSFFSQIADDIAPLIQTWLPAVAEGMSQIAGIFGQAAHEFLGLLQQPQMMAAFQSFVTNIGSGLQALTPAIAPLLQMFTQLTVAGSSFFEQIGGDLTGAISTFAGMINEASSNGSLQQWIQTGINAFERLGNIIFNVAYAFGNIMDVAENFGGGGLLGWLEQLSGELAKWTSSAEGQKALTDFFSALRTATDAFTPLLGPLVQGLSSIGVAFVNLGVAAAPGFLAFMNGFAAAMAQLGPHLVGIAPAITQFMTDLGGAMVRIVQTVGPQLPTIFEAMSNAFSALLPQLPPLIQIFTQLIERVGPQLPKLFEAVTNALIALVPLMPTIIGFIRDFVSVLTIVVDIGTGVIETVTKIAGGIVTAGNAINDALGVQLPQHIRDVADKIEGFFKDLPSKAVQWGKNIITGLIDGLKDSLGLGGLSDAAKGIVDNISKWFQSSPAKVGPFSGSGYTLIRGQKMVQDMAAGMVSAQGAVSAAARTTAEAASGALGAAAGTATGAQAAAPGGADAVGGALLPPWIAGADTSILSAYLQHQFPENRGLKGLAKNLGKILTAAQDGFNLVTQGIMQPMFTALGLIPGLGEKRWTKMSPEQAAAQQEQDLEKKAAGGKKQGLSWADVTGSQTGVGNSLAGGIKGGTPLGLSAKSSKEDIQKAIVAAGRGRGMNDAAIQTALAVAAAESGFNPTISGGVQGSAGLVSGLYQQSPSSGWGTLDQVNDPNHAINAFYDAYAKNLTKNPSNPQLAAVLTQNPQLGSNAQGSDYWNAVSAQLGAGKQILDQQGAGAKGPSWDQITAATPSGTYGLPKGTDTGGYGTGNAETFPPWVMEMAKEFGVLPSTYKGHQESDRGGEAGYAPNPNHENRGIDWSGSVDKMQAFAEFLSKNASNMPGLEQIIWQNPNTGQKIGLGGAGNLDPGYYPQDTYDKHGNHVHTRQSAPLLPGSGPTGGIGDSLSGGLTVGGGKTVDQLLDTSQKNLSVNDQLLQAYLQGNPALATQIDAAKSPGAPDSTVMSALTGIDTTIADLKKQDATGNQNTISALQSTQSQIAQNSGFQQSPSALSTAQSVASGAANAVTGAFQVLSSGLDVLTATQDIADRLVYGVRNTEDIMKLVDNVQKYITFAADIANETGSILSTVGGLVGAGAGSDPSGSTAAASAALSMAATISQLVGAALQGVNMAIDLGQEVYHLVGTQVGKWLSQMTAGLGGDPLMGDVRMLLNKNTGQLITYSQDNPGNQNTLNVPTGLNKTYDYGGGSNQNPGYNQQWNIYAGPGQSTNQMLNETMWMVQTAGTTGAMAASNF